MEETRGERYALVATTGIISAILIALALFVGSTSEATKTSTIEIKTTTHSSTVSSSDSSSTPVSSTTSISFTTTVVSSSSSESSTGPPPCGTYSGSYEVTIDGIPQCFVSTSTGSAVNPSTGSLTIQSIGQNGSSIRGYYTYVSNSNGTVAGTGYTPITFPSLDFGQSYTVTVENYAGCAFVHWTNLYQNASMPITAYSPGSTFTAVYTCG